MDGIDAAIEQFHRMWDAFPGMARLIGADHRIVAANEAARAKGFVEDAVCARVGTPVSHRGCLMQEMLADGQGRIDRPAPDRIRGWLPVCGRPELFVHFTLLIPEEHHD